MCCVVNMILIVLVGGVYISKGRERGGEKMEMRLEVLFCFMDDMMQWRNATGQISFCFTGQEKPGQAILAKVELN